VYRWVEHTGELELRVEAPTEEGVFAESLTALGELLGEETAGELVREELDLAAPDRASLLVDWLNELVFLAETKAFVPERAAILELREGGLRATVEGRRGTPSPLVKAVTYNHLDFSPRRGGWQARVVLDV
jgi:SHS2 domain-containing protein